MEQNAIRTMNLLHLDPNWMRLLQLSLYAIISVLILHPQRRGGGEVVFLERWPSSVKKSSWSRQSTYSLSSNRRGLDRDRVHTLWDERLWKFMYCVAELKKKYPKLNLLLKVHIEKTQKCNSDPCRPKRCKLLAWRWCSSKLSSRSLEPFVIVIVIGKRRFDGHCRMHKMVLSGLVWSFIAATIPCFQEECVKEKDETTTWVWVWVWERSASWRMGTWYLWVVKVIARS
jgi:hypothetical protein